MLLNNSVLFRELPNSSVPYTFKSFLRKPEFKDNLLLQDIIFSLHSDLTLAQSS